MIKRWFSSIQIPDNCRKIGSFYYHLALCFFLLKNKMSIIATSCGIYAIFSYLVSGFWALEYRSTY